MVPQAVREPQDTRESLYVCVYCYQVCDNPISCHSSPMLVCRPGVPGSERRKPLVDRSGNLLSRAPRWFLEATGWINALAPYTVWRDL